MFLKFTFVDRIAYKRKEGFRTPQPSVPFEFLSCFGCSEKMAHHFFAHAHAQLASRGWAGKRVCPFLDSPPNRSPLNFFDFLDKAS